jgi:hypothetical protein
MSTFFKQPGPALPGEAPQTKIAKLEDFETHFRQIH